MKRNFEWYVSQSAHGGTLKALKRRSEVSRVGTGSVTVTSREETKYLHKAEPKPGVFDFWFLIIT